MELTNVLALNYPLTQKLGITDEIFQTVMRYVHRGRHISETIHSATQKGRLFVTDYDLLASDNITAKPNQYLTAPIALYYGDRVRFSGCNKF